MSPTTRDESSIRSNSVCVIGLDHLVLNVSDVERSPAFYMDQLGLKPVRVDEWRCQEVFFPSVRVDDTTIIDLVDLPRTGENSDHVCLVVEPMDFEGLKASGRFNVVEGPDRRYGARGDGVALCIRDPDSNLLELRYYDEP
jgi:catechol 2,3-dioxygenase-like lactoylglutathione lyase family enzyme